MVRLRPGDVERQLRTVFTSGTVAGLTDAELLDRFLGRRDDGASFEALVARHGPMVLGVCRDLLGDEHAADDAFQATFLVLVRKAASVRVGDSLGRWLYGVAHRVARHARSDAARRRRREGMVEASLATDSTPVADAERADLRAALHDELARLPAAFRAPIVLCHLEGLTHEEAAQQLRCPVGTVRSRLARGRERLRGRLVRRGVAPAVALGVLERSTRAAVPAQLAAATATAAARFAGGAGVGAISVSVLTLTKGVLLSMTLGPLKVAATGLMAAGLISVAATGVVAQQGAPAPGPAPKPAAGPSGDMFKVSPKKGSVEELRYQHQQMSWMLRDRIEEAVNLIRSGKSLEAGVPLKQAMDIAREIGGEEVPPRAEPVAPPDIAKPAAETPPRAEPAARPGPAPKAVDPFASPAPGAEPARSDEVAVATEPSAQELITEWRYAIAFASRSKKRFSEGLGSFEALSAAENRRDRALDRIKGLVDRYRDELEVLRVRLRKQQAEVQRARAQSDPASAILGRLKQLNERRAVSAETVTEAETKAVAAAGSLAVAQVDLEMIEVLIRQAERHLAPLQRFLDANKPPVPAGARP
jgi:RNA polymerase sigma factor (sigma-70 family)